MALGLAVNARGADHNRSGAYEADLSGEHDRLSGGPAQVAAAVGTEDRAAGDGLDDPVQVPARRSSTSRSPSGRRCCARSPVGTSTRRAALRPRGGSCSRSGCSTCARAPRPRTTRCRRRLLETPLELGSGRAAALTDDRLRAMVGGYYAARGWDGEGRPDGGAACCWVVVEDHKVGSGWPRDRLV
jgi:aldehyde:ferredoxin oxidoreductase